ncbi:MAG: EpsI family protein [Gemmataceae bacterium]|nr:EpsI family protein [Gemmataceae bacterium]
MTNWTYAGAAAALVVATGLLHGFWTDRWASSSDLVEAVERLKALPANVGEWEGKDLECKPGPGVAGCFQRTYANKRLGVSVVVALFNGRPGPVATHTPEVCYGANGYRVGAKKAVGLDSASGPAQFWTADAAKDKAGETQKLRLHWAWNAGDGWVASKDARDEFPRLRHSVLHKLYVLRDLAQGSPAGPEPSELFLKEFIPAMDAALFN